MKRYSMLIISVWFMISCNEKKGHTDHPEDTPIKGAINISVDESFAPVIREQIAMYEALNPETKINASYKSEADCIRDLFNDSANRMVIITRGLTDREEKAMTGAIGFNPAWTPIAYDAVAVVVNKNSNDSLFSVKKLHDLLTGKSTSGQSFIFDGLNRTGTVRYAEDSVLRGDHFDSSVVRAVKSSKEVLDYVASHKEAVGFVGINQIGNPEDTAQVSMLRKVKLAYMKCDACVNTPYVLPSQQSILQRRYPLVRGLYYVLKENFNGLGSGFAAFLQYEKGQLIFRRAYLAPVMNFGVRDVKINSTLPSD